MACLYRQQCISHSTSVREVHDEGAHGLNGSFHIWFGFCFGAKQALWFEALWFGFRFGAKQTRLLSWTCCLLRQLSDGDVLRVVELHEWLVCNKIEIPSAWPIERRRT